MGFLCSGNISHLLFIHEAEFLRKQDTLKSLKRRESEKRSLSEVVQVGKRRSTSCAVIG